MTPAPEPSAASPLSPDALRQIDAYWRAANYLSVGQIYLCDNPLLERPLTHADVKPHLLGHWGTTPGLNLIYVHLNRLIKARDLDMMVVVGPGHGGPGIVAHSYLEGTYTEHYPAIERNRNGLYRLFRQFSWPNGIPSHVSPEVPGSIHEGGELGYSLAHAYGAAFDNPGLIVACVVGDGEAETGALAASWHSNKFLNPVRDGAVLPILHLNGYKIANPTVLARIDRDELTDLMRGYGHEPHFVEGDDPAAVHQALAATLETVCARIDAIQREARALPHGTAPVRPRWPMIVLKTPKGWTGPKFVDGLPVEGTWRSHQVPIVDCHSDEHLQQLEDWLLSYRPGELFDEHGALREDLAALAPTGRSRMGSNLHGNGGALLQALAMPDFRSQAVAVPEPGGSTAEPTRVLGKFLREVMRRNMTRQNFRLFGPDETASNRLAAVYVVSGKEWMARVEDNDTDLSTDGRVMEVLSEHLCQGWLEGYLLTGRHGLFSCYEAFIHIIDSMLNQHAKWLKVTRQIAWRKPIASLNYLLTSHVWQQDHNGFSHQDPGFLDHVANKKAGVVRIYLPPDANCLLSVADHCLRSRNYINVIVAGKQPAAQWLDIDAAVRHCAAGAGIWDWASDAGEPDVVMACAGDVPTLETLAAVTLLRAQQPGIRIRVVNVVDLMALQPTSEHPHGMDDVDFDALFTRDKPVIFAFHGYPALIHRLTYRRRNHANLHVRGYKEEGTTTTSFDMVVLNDLDRFRLTLDAVERIPRLAGDVHAATARYWATMERHKLYIGEHGMDLPEVRGLALGACVTKALVVNAGSSSIKFGVFEPSGGDDLRALAKGRIREVERTLELHVQDGRGRVLDQTRAASTGDAYDPAQAMALLFDWIDAHASGALTPTAVGHRVVHGGPDFVQPLRITDTALQALDALVPLAPLHQPHNLRPIHIVRERWPHLPQVACFDTAFHATQPPVARACALPRAITDSGVRRYGFHGLSYEFVASRLPQVLGEAAARGRVIVAHLGNGASLCALADGRSVATTMGFSVLDGLVMGTRCGSLDAGVLLYLMQGDGQCDGLTAAQLGELLYERSGLLGVSGVSSDMDALLHSPDPHAAEAVDLFVYRVVTEIGALAAALGGLDALVFTAGIGENAAAIRARISKGCGWLGAALDAGANAADHTLIHAPGSALPLAIIPTDEEWMIALHTVRCVTPPG